MHCDTQRRNAINLLSDTHVLTDRGNDSPAGWIGLHSVQLMVKGQQWERARHRVQNSVCVCVRACMLCMSEGLIVVQLWGTAERAHIWHRGTSMVTANLTTQPVLWWQVCSCACVCVCVCSWESVTGGRRKCEKERVKSVLKKGRWAVKCLSAHPTCSHASFKNSKQSW